MCSTELLPSSCWAPQAGLPVGQPGSGKGCGQLVPASTPGCGRASGPLAWGDVAVSPVAARAAAQGLRHTGRLRVLQQAIDCLCGDGLWTTMTPLVPVTSLAGGAKVPGAVGAQGSSSKDGSSGCPEGWCSGCAAGEKACLGPCLPAGRAAFALLFSHMLRASLGS